MPFEYGSQQVDIPNPFRFEGIAYTVRAAALILLGLVWSYMHHLFAGIRYLLLDIHVGTALQPARTSARLVLALGLAATVLIGVRIW